MANSISDLRQHLFDAIEGLRNGSLDIEDAKAIAEVSQVVINSAKVEVDFMKARGKESKQCADFIDGVQVLEPRSIGKPKTEPFKGAPALPRVVRGMAASGD